jgi:hypothetical protein
MAPAVPPPTAAIPINITATLSAAIPIKLDQENFLLWKAQAMPALIGNDLMAFVDGSNPAPPKLVPAETGSSTQVANPAFAAWRKTDQQILSGLLTSLTPPVLGHVQLLKTSAQVWEALDRTFASRSKARIVQLRTALVRPKKRDVTMSTYFQNIKKIADTMATIGNPLGDDEIVSYILAGLAEDHENFTTSMSMLAGKDDFSLNDLYGHMTAYEARHGDRASGGQFQHSANNASRGGGHGYQGGRGGGGRGRGDGRGNGGGRHHGGFHDNGGHNGYGGGYGGYQGGFNGGGNGGGRGHNPGRDGSAQGGGGGRGRGGGKSTCQICGIYGHDALRCYSRFNHAIQPETSNRQASYSYSTSNANDYGDNWVLDSGATDHMTNDMSRLHVQDAYQGNDQIQVANGMHVPILHIGESSLPGSTHPLCLKNVLHAPALSKNLLSASKLAFDNHCFVELHPDCFFIKDRTTKQTRLQGRGHHGLYPVPHPRHRQALHSAPSKDLWHQRLGHPERSRCRLEGG